MSTENLTYEQRRKLYFEKLLDQKKRMIDYWLDRGAYECIKQVEAKIGFIEDAMRALDSVENHLCLTCAENRYGACESQNVIVCKNYRRNTE